MFRQSLDKDLRTTTSLVVVTVLRFNVDTITVWALVLVLVVFLRVFCGA